MRVRKLILSILSIGLCCAKFAFAGEEIKTTTSAVPFLLIAPDSRASGMGENGVAIADNVWAVYWNPAGLAFQTGSELGLTHANWLPGLGLADLWIAHLAYKQAVEELDGTVAGQITYLSYGEIIRTGDTGPEQLGVFTSYEFAIAAGYSTKISENTGIGINARLIHSHLSPFGTGKEGGEGIATGFCFDLGLLYKPKRLVIPFTNYDMGNKINFGLSLSNIGPKLAYIDRAQADPLPMYLRMGIAYKILESEYNNINFTTEFSRLLVARWGDKTDEFYKAFFTTWMYKSFNEQMRKFVSSIGAEYWYGSPKLFGVRFGYFYEDPNEGNRKFLTFGAGIRYDLYGFDFSYISALEERHPLGETLRLSLSIGW